MERGFVITYVLPRHAAAASCGFVLFAPKWARRRPF